MGLSELHQRIDLPIARDRQCVIGRDNVGNLKGDEEDQQRPIEWWQRPTGRIGDYRAEAPVKAPVRGIPGFFQDIGRSEPGIPMRSYPPNRKQKVKYGVGMPPDQSIDWSTPGSGVRPRAATVGVKGRGWPRKDASATTEPRMRTRRLSTRDRQELRAERT
jgi:hypothetical protein